VCVVACDIVIKTSSPAQTLGEIGATFVCLCAAVEKRENKRENKKKRKKVGNE
jgi:hypothetical protein